MVLITTLGLVLFCFIGGEEWRKVGQKFGRVMREYRPGKKVKEGQRLQQELTRYLLLRGLQDSSQALPKYKFYDSLWAKLLNYKRTLGVPIGPQLQELKQVLRQDLAVESKLQAEIQGGLWQCLSMAAIILGLVIYTYFLLEKRSVLPLLMVAVWQTIGISLYAPLVFWQQRRLINWSEDYIQTLISLRVLLAAGLPLSQTLKLSNPEQCFTHRNHLLYQERLREIIWSLKEKGLPVLEECQELLAEVKEAREMLMGQLIKRVALIKLLIMGTFFLASYLFYLASFFSSLLADW